MKLGQVVETCGIAEAIDRDREFGKFVSESFTRYLRHDWGVPCDDTRVLNDAYADTEGEMILGVYVNDEGRKIWIITEWDHSVTTILFPEEY